jgi:hypothetical protein
VVRRYFPTRAWPDGAGLPEKWTALILEPGKAAHENRSPPHEKALNALALLLGISPSLAEKVLRRTAGRRTRG